MVRSMSENSGIMMISIILFLSALHDTTVYARISTAPVKMEKPVQSADCLKCHADNINMSRFARSVHGTNSCTSCHRDITDLRKHADGILAPQQVECAICHSKESGEFPKSVHRVREQFTCVECHADIHYLQPWDGSKKQIIKKCTICHKDTSYLTSGHERAVMKGNDDAAVCSDCHGLHDTNAWHTAGEKYPVEARRFYTSACNKCHADKELMKKNNLTTIAVETYEQSIHGKIQKLGYPAAGCADCHTSHNILPKDDPNSTVNEKNLISLCSRCHKGANANLIKFIPHADFGNREKYPQLFWTRIFMISLLVVVLFFNWGHTFLWWRKAYWEKQKLLAEGHLITDKLDSIKNPGETYIRFKLRDRMLHLTIVLTFFGLAATGIPIKFSNAPWAKFVLGLFADYGIAVLIHRICAFILIAAFCTVIVYCIHFVFFNKKAGSTVKERLFGPYSLMPRKKDLEDFIIMIKWFTDQGPPPRFDHWTYWEKFDFIAVFWGMIAIGLTGLIMWMPQATTVFMPGWIINIARIIHSEEALLAISFIFTVHFFNTHFVPTKWPMNYSIFTGRIYKWEFIEDRPLEYERLEKTNGLESLKATFPNILTNFLSGLIGLSALVIGLLTIILIIWAFAG